MISSGWVRTIAAQVFLWGAIFALVRFFYPPADEPPTHRNVLCKVLPICVAYMSARNDCATAANFNDCLHVKIDGGDYDKLMFCNNDGTLASTDPEQPAPDALECWVRNNTRFYR